MQSWRNRLALVAALALAACFPELDWREFASADGGFKVMLPGRPAHEAREITLAGVKTMMHMDSAQAGEMAAARPRNRTSATDVTAACT